MQAIRFPANLLSTLLGRLSVTFLVAFFATMAMATESSFIVNPVPKKGSFDLEISRERKSYFLNSDGSRRGSSGGLNEYSDNGPLFKAKSTATLLSMGYIHPFSETSNLTTTGTFAVRDFQADSTSTGASNEATSTADDAQVTGFRNITANYKYGQQYESFTAIYGGEITLSPGASKDPVGINDSLTPKAANNSLGYHALAPYIGVESYVGEIALGATAQFSQYLPLSDSGAVSSRSTGNNLVATFKGFVEIPVDQKWDVGLAAAVGRSDLAIDRLLFGSSGKNETSAQAYADYKLDKQSSVSFHIRSEDRQHPYTESNSDLGITLKKAL